MRITAISDVHIKSPHDEADQLLCRFLDHPVVRESDYIALLGDIFDLMCGPHAQYLKLYGHIFERLDVLMKSGKRVFFFEGNHDVHLEKLFKKYWKMNEITPSQVAIVEEIDGKTYYFSHGDEHEVDNLSYQKYKKLITTPGAKFVADYLVPYTLFHYVGNKASQKSRQKGSRIFNYELVKERFRAGVDQFTEGKFDFVLGGHSHVKDIYHSDKFGYTYVNNGYALQEKTFILIENHQISFLAI